MTLTVYGELASADGTARDRGERMPWRNAAGDYRANQGAGTWPVRLEHDGPTVGEIVYLERAANGSLMAVAHVDDSVRPTIDVAVGDEIVTLEHDLYWSSETFRDDDGTILLHAAAITRSPARLMPQPLQLLDGELSYRQVADERWHLRGAPRELLTRAATSYLDRRAAGSRSLRIRDADHELDLERLTPAERYVLVAEQADEAWQHRPLRTRPGRILDVR